MKYLILICLIFLVESASAQLTEGAIKDSKTQEALPYVNIGIIGKNIGTVSTLSGEFSLATPQANDSDTVRISMLGYKPRMYKVPDFRKLLSANRDIFLEPVSIQLQDVAIKPKKLKEKILGNNTESQSTTAGFSSNKLGNEIGIIIKIKKSPSYIRTFTASVASHYDKPIKMRLNFYSVKNGLPDKILLNQNIIFDAKIINQKISINLDPYNIIVDDDFFVSLEWIENSPGHGIHFSSSLFGSPLIARQTSQGSWEKVGLFGLGFTVKAAY